MPVYESPLRVDTLVEDPTDPGSESLAEMAVCCAWCGRFQTQSRWVDPTSFPEPDRTTYGMCPDCFCSYSAEHFATPSAARRRYDRCVNGLPFADTVARLRPNLEGFDALVEAVWGRVASRRPLRTTLP